MGIANYKPNHRKHHTDVPKPKREDYDTITQNNRECALKKAVDLADTTPWIVEYYAQQLGQDDATSHSDPDLSPVYQQYCRTAGYTLNLLGGLSNGEGEAVVTNMIPHVGDVIIAKADTPWLFLRVTEVETLEPKENPNYKIQIKEFGYTSATDEHYMDLQNKLSCKKVVSPTGDVITESALDQQKVLHKYYCTVAKSYMATFVDTDSELLLYKDDQGNIVYDHHLAKMVNKTISYNYMYHKHGYRLVYVHDEVPYNTIISLLLNPNELILGTRHDKVPFLTKGAFSDNFQASSFLHQPVTLFSETADVTQEGEHDNYINTILTVTPKVYEEVDGMSNIKSVLTDDYYIFSEGFYATEPTNLSLLEDTILRTIDGCDVHIASIIELYKGYHEWDPIDRFYYTPFLLMLSHYALGGK